ncbi:outer membrane lipoprotein chaperone LolA [Marinobacter halodurans]|uniref:Outer-membrane lipoprotein carrier protein n=1 Tax=Marinobacter halodurans TaxID=2528979 RepID=A0ABY1ZLI6_9GAMM|nr:outer membrane lipoprotein chaperone LolA [Marinobacter halodurans]TBW54757.1 outer membrane lipoprotein chaperone LolA [Marinobacter halodurans]
MKTFMGRVSAVLAVLLISTSPAWADAQAAKALAGKLEKYRTYQADFIQVVVDGTGSKVQETRGNLKAKRPGLFFWESKSPFSQTIVADGKKVEVYDPDLEQVTIKPMEKQMSSTPALLLSGQVDNLEEAYDVSRDEETAGADDFILKPRSQDSLFLSLRLRFRDDVLTEMRLRDSLDQISVLSFQDVKVNQPVDNSVFHLDYPDSVDVIKSAQ